VYVKYRKKFLKIPELKGLNSGKNNNDIIFSSTMEKVNKPLS
jgi:hypothetical protein